MNDNFKRSLALIAVSLLLLPTLSKCAQNDTFCVCSPDEKILLHFSLQKGKPCYGISYRNHMLIEPSSLGLSFSNSQPFDENFQVTGVDKNNVNESWEPVWGKSKVVRNHYNQLLIKLKEKTAPKRFLNLIFRVYDDGVAFRYDLPRQKNLNEFILTSENTRLQFAGNYTCYTNNPALDAGRIGYHIKTPLQKITADSLIATPLLIQAANCWMAIAEADVTDYTTMFLAGDTASVTGLTTKLEPYSDNQEFKVRAHTPHSSPWRVLMIAERAGDLIESNLIINLNGPCRIAKTSWIKPGKVLWPWWNRWFTAGAPDIRDGRPSTAQMKYYIDFAAKHGIAYLLIDAGWYSLEEEAWEQPEKENPLTMEETSRDYYGVQEVIAYAKHKGVGVHLWVHATSLLGKVEQVLSAYAKWGAVGIKVDSDAKGNQQFVNHIHHIVKAAAENHLMVNLHSMCIPDGICRTYPNLMTREAVAGLEIARERPGPQPEHNVMIPYTRMLVGPMDYTPGAFDLDGTEKYPKYVLGTRSHQIAMHIIYFSALQMLPDYPAAYESAPEQFDFLKRIPASWDQTIFLRGHPGEFIALARRTGQEWYVGVMTDEKPRDIEFSLDFLDSKKRYTALICKDAPDADINREHVIVEKKKVTAQDNYIASLVGGGGQAIRFIPLNSH